MNKTQIHRQQLESRGEPCVRPKMAHLFLKELKRANTRFTPTHATFQENKKI
jgi:hypothetical protein